MEEVWRSGGGLEGALYLPIGGFPRGREGLPIPAYRGGPLRGSPCTADTGRLQKRERSPYICL